ncbi:uncharacterized protein METZ01_LOCUS319215, partial [marine metagenome]
MAIVTKRAYDSGSIRQKGRGWQI